MFLLCPWTIPKILGYQIIPSHLTLFGFAAVQQGSVTE